MMTPKKKKSVYVLACVSVLSMIVGMILTQVFKIPMRNNFPALIFMCAVFCPVAAILLIYRSSLSEKDTVKKAICMVGVMLIAVALSVPAIINAFYMH